jgi:hypothetical protein
VNRRLTLNPTDLGADVSSTALVFDDQVNALNHYAILIGITAYFPPLAVDIITGDHPMHRTTQRFSLTPGFSRILANDDLDRITSSYPFHDLISTVNSEQSCTACSQNLRRQGHDLHKSHFAKLTSNRAKDARSHGVLRFIQNHGRVVIKLDISPIAPVNLFGCSNDHCLDDITLFDRTAWGSALDRGDDNIAYSTIASCRATKDAYAQDFLAPRIVGHSEPALLLNHLFPPAFPDASDFPASERPSPQCDMLPIGT